MADDIEITTAVEQGVVSVAGELDARTCPPVREAALAMLQARARCAATPTERSPACLLDLSEVTFVASAALSLLLELDARAAASGLKLALVVAPEGALQTQLQRTGLLTQFTVLPPGADDAPTGDPETATDP